MANLNWEDPHHQTHPSQLIQFQINQAEIEQYQNITEKTFNSDITSCILEYIFDPNEMAKELTISPPFKVLDGDLIVKPSMQTYGTLDLQHKTNKTEVSLSVYISGIPTVIFMTMQYDNDTTSEFVEYDVDWNMVPSRNILRTDCTMRFLLRRRKHFFVRIYPMTFPLLNNVSYYQECNNINCHEWIHNLASITFKEHAPQNFLTFILQNKRIQSLQKLHECCIYNILYPFSMSFAEQFADQIAKCVIEQIQKSEDTWTKVECGIEPDV